MWHMPQPRCGPISHVTCHNHIWGPWFLWHVPYCEPMIHACDIWAHDSCDTCLNHIMGLWWMWHDHNVGLWVMWHVTMTLWAHVSCDTCHALGLQFILTINPFFGNCRWFYHRQIQRSLIIYTVAHSQTCFPRDNHFQRGVHVSLKCFVACMQLDKLHNSGVRYLFVLEYSYFC